MKVNAELIRQGLSQEQRNMALNATAIALKHALVVMTSEMA
jgi:hypothetical protein